MEHISTCSSEYGNWYWDTETITKARGFLHQLNSFEFLVAFNVTMRILNSLHSLTVKLQKASNDILGAYELVSEVQMNLELLKTNYEEEFHLWFNEVKTLTDELDIAVSTPRITARQVHRANVPADSPEEYYQRNLMIPFLDHITTELEGRFGPIHQTKVKLLGLIPYHLLQLALLLPLSKKLVICTKQTCHHLTCSQQSLADGRADFPPHLLPTTRHPRKGIASVR